jgi:hypothetical protein
MTITQENLRAQVETARGRLGDTVEELAAKADVKAHAQHKAAEVKHVIEDKTPESVRTAAGKAARTGREKPMPTALAGTALALALAFVVLRHRKGGS